MFALNLTRLVPVWFHSFYPVSKVFMLPEQIDLPFCD
jgi:hypothetical protein